MGGDLIFTGNIGGEELDTLIELIIAMLFMGICIVLTGGMCIRMTKYVSHTHKIDKVEINADASSIENPFYFTGYEAYMFAWMMDPYSDEQISWLADDSSYVSAPSDTSITIGVLDKDGNSITNFLSIRNRLITGANINNSVRNVLRQVLGESQANQFYAGETNTYMHLIFTDKKYVNGGPPDDGRRYYSWILIPEVR